VLDRLTGAGSSIIVLDTWRENPFPQVASPDGDAARQVWDFVRRSERVADLQVLIDRFDGCFMADLALTALEYIHTLSRRCNVRPRTPGLVGPTRPG